MMLKKVSILIAVIVCSLFGYFTFKDNVTYIEVEGFSKQEQELKNKYLNKKFYSNEELDQMSKEVMELNELKMEKLIKKHQESRSK